MSLEEYKGVYVFAQQVDNKLSGIAFELLGKAKELASALDTEVAAVLIGSDVKGLADDLAAYGADKVIVVDDPDIVPVRQRIIKDRQQRPVDLQRQHLPGAPGQRLGERTEARPDFQHAVLLRDQRKPGQLLEQRFVLDKVLTQAVLMMKALLCGFQ